jgi:hypothetical protein
MRTGDAVASIARIWACNGDHPRHPQGRFRPRKDVGPLGPQAVVSSPEKGESGLQWQLLGAPSVALIGGPEQYSNHGRVHRILPHP